MSRMSSRQGVSRADKAVAIMLDSGSGSRVDAFHCNTTRAEQADLAAYVVSRAWTE